MRLGQQNQFVVSKTAIENGNASTEHQQYIIMYQFSLQQICEKADFPCNKKQRLQRIMEVIRSSELTPATEIAIQNFPNNFTSTPNYMGERYLLRQSRRETKEELVRAIQGSSMRHLHQPQEATKEKEAVVEEEAAGAADMVTEELVMEAYQVGCHRRDQNFIGVDISKQHHSFTQQVFDKFASHCGRKKQQ